MRTLRFIVDGETVTKDPSCDFTGLSPRNASEICAEFVFSPEWDGRVKVVAFQSMLDKEYEPQLLGDDNTCEIPKEALAKPAFKIHILGKHKGRVYKTTKFIVHQRGGAK